MGTACSLGGTGSNRRVDTTEEPATCSGPGPVKDVASVCLRGQAREELRDLIPTAESLLVWFLLFPAWLLGVEDSGSWLQDDLQFAETSVSANQFNYFVGVLNGEGLNQDNLELCLHECPASLLKSPPPRSLKSGLHQKHGRVFRPRHNLRFFGPKSELDR